MRSACGRDLDNCTALSVFSDCRFYVQLFSTEEFGVISDVRETQTRTVTWYRYRLK